MNKPAPAAPRHRRVRPGLVETTDPHGNTWTVEERRDTFGGGNGWAWFASRDDDPSWALDPTDTLRDALNAVAVPVSDA